MSNLATAFRILLLPLTIAVSAGLLVRGNLLQTFSIPSASMSPTLEPGDHILVTPYGGIFADHPRRGDVIVFADRGWNTQFYVKRIIGVPGDTVEVRDGWILVNGDVTMEPQAVTWSQHEPIGASLGEGEYFVMGDNRPNSIDSRSWGPLRRDQILGRARAIFWSDGLRGSDPAANAEALRSSAARVPAVRWTRILSPVR